MTLLRIVQGLTSGRCFLSCTPDGATVDLWNGDDGSGRQQWILEKIDTGLLETFSGPIYNIIVSGGVENSRRYLSCTADGSKVDLWHEDDNSGRQKWAFNEVGSQLYQITVAAGVEGNRRYLSCTPDGLTVDLWSVDDASGRQQWYLQ